MPGRYWVRERAVRRQHKAHAARETMSVEMTKAMRAARTWRGKGSNATAAYVSKGLALTVWRAESAGKKYVDGLLSVDWRRTWTTG